jgi:hypothetical protein
MDYSDATAMMRILFSFLFLLKMTTNFESFEESIEVKCF